MLEKNEIDYGDIYNLELPSQSLVQKDFIGAVAVSLRRGNRGP